MTLTPAAQRELVDTLSSIKQAIFRAHKAKARRLAVTAATLRRVGVTGDEMWLLFSELGDLLGRRIANEHLSVGVHRTVRTRLSKVNNATVAWQAGFQNVLMGRPIKRSEVLEIQQLLAYSVMESHHVVEARMFSHFIELQMAYNSTDDMIGVALFADKHRGVAYMSLGKDNAATKALLKSDPPSTKNLTAALLEKFNNNYLAESPPFKKFLLDLAAFYKENVPAEMYKHGDSGGLLRGLQQVAKDTNTSIPASSWP